MSDIQPSVLEEVPTAAAAPPASADHPVPVDRISELYRGEIFSDEDVRVARDRIHWMCAQCEGDSVLDVGCSQGIASILLAREGFSVTAIDVHPESVAYARAEWAREAPAVRSRLSIVETDLATLPDGPGFDSILLGEVIEHQARPERLLQAARARLNPRGRMIVTTPFGLHPHPDHKVSLFPSDLVRFAREMDMGISDLHVDGSYMRCVYVARAEPAQPYPDLQDLLDRTQRATLEAEQRLHDLLGQRAEQLKARADAHKITQRKLAEATTALGEKDQALKITQRKLAEATTALGEKDQALKITQRKLAEATTALGAKDQALGEKDQALKITQRKLAEATTTLGARDQALGEKDQALKITQRKLAEATTALGAKDQALGEKDQALKITQRKLAEATTALGEKERAFGEKDQALKVTQRKLAEATTALGEKEGAFGEKDRALRITQRKLAETTTTLAEKGQALKITQRKLAEATTALGEKGRALDITQRKVEVRDARLQAMQRRVTAVSERNERIVASASHRVGNALVAAARSPSRALRLPSELWRIYRDVKVRRAADQARIDAPAAEQVVPAVEAPARQVAAAPRVASSAALVPAAAVAPPFPALPTDLKRLKVASVMDEFTFHSFAPECNLLPLRPQTWEAQLVEFAPDLVFIESAWRGADDLWTQKVSNPSTEIMGVIAWAASNRVPTVFWNKEDPAHFGGFLHIARAVDYVFTTDIDCIARYKRELGHERVFLLPFAAQPAVHNPIERFERADAFCFAGSYYLKYLERQRDFKSLVNVVEKLRPVEIYDRNFHKPHPHYEFPPEYERLIVGSLPFDQIDKAYKGYRFGININTVKQSQTMFARRVFELLASNTVVVSNFSRAVRLLFGDLVVCSDAPAELERRLTALCADETGLRKFRLAGVRKILAEHTYAHRLGYVASKLSRQRVQPAPVGITVLAWPADAAQAQHLLRMFRAQTHGARQLCLLGARPSDAATSDHVLTFAADDVAGLRVAIDGMPWVAPWSAHDHYGDNYLTDLALATTYSQASAIGKGAYYSAAAGPVTLLTDGAQYRAAASLDARCSMVKSARAIEWLLARPPGPELHHFEADDQFAVDEFNYCREVRDDAEAADAVGDDPALSLGLSLAADVFPLAEAIRPAPVSSVASDAAELPGRGAAELAAELARAAPADVKLQMVDGALQVRSELAADKHVYLYVRESQPRAALNLEFNTRFQLQLDEVEKGLDLRTVFEFLDADRRKLGHAMMKAGAAYSMAIPARCVYVRFGLRVQGGGVARIRRLVLGDVRERPSTLVASARHLIVAKQYPSYDDLYRYGFVHSRVRGYRRQGLAVDVFRLSAEEPCVFREFDGINVIQGDRDMLDLALRSGQYGHVLVHLLDEQMWETLATHLDRLKVTVWVHGAEIQAWHRRAFEFDRFDETEVARRKAMANLRVAFWNRILAPPHPNLSLVFVSRYLADEAKQDLGVDLSRVPHEIIHNFVDGALFAYHPKTVDQRLRLLSIRPFNSRAYANDLTVQAILLLAQRPRFAEYAIRIIGDGELFEETTRPLAGLANVTLERRFVTQAEIASLHRDFGVFVCPTRMDTQGVSRDEAMASGLVPVTTRVAAVPEFVDESCAVLVEPESAVGLADAIEALRDDPGRFLELSASAARRVRRQSGFEATILREIALLEDRCGAPSGEVGTDRAAQQANSAAESLA